LTTSRSSYILLTEPRRCGAPIPPAVHSRFIHFDYTCFMMRLKRRYILGLVAAAVLLAAIAFLHLRRNGKVRYQTATVDRGDIVEIVGATGTLQAVTTVQVGSQVSGIIASLHADFNSTVHRGDVVARLDPSLFEARLGQAKASLVSARANVDRSRASLEDTRQKLARAKELYAEKLLPLSDLETAQANYDSAAAQLKASAAAVVQAEANVNQAQVDLNHTIISAPIDGVVIARNFDVGQTVAASFQAPTLFIIANDLSRMQVNASIDESDIGRVRTGQDVTFRVDAYPERAFPGRVQQVRLQPTTVQNVVTYNTIIEVENPGQRLMPGMTATVSVIVRRRDGALRIPSAVLRFRPETEDRGTPARPAAGARTVSGAGQNRASDSGGQTDRRSGSRSRRDSDRSQPPGRADGESGSSGRDSGRRSTVYILSPAGTPQATDVELGISDGQFVEVRTGLEEGTKVIVGIELTPSAGPRAGSTPGGAANPFAPTRPQGRQR
jgi:HlyD family secretion protein